LANRSRAARKLYQISGCGVCNDCPRGYMISCTSEYRRAYGWQRDGGMAEYILAEEKDLVHLPDLLSYSDGAQVACGFGAIVAAIKEHNSDLVGLSALLTTTMPSMKATIEALGNDGLRDKVKVLVGGAPVTQAYSDQIGAFGFAPDASSAARKAKGLMGIT